MEGPAWLNRDIGRRYSLWGSSSRRLLSFVLGLGDMCLYALCLAGEGWVNCFVKYGINCFLWYQLPSTMVLLMVLLNYGIAFNYGKYQSR